GSALGKAPDLDTATVQLRDHFAQKINGARGIAVGADRLGIDLQDAAIDSRNRAMLCDFEDAIHHISWVVQDRIGFTTADQRAVWIVIAVGKGLANDRQAGLLCDPDGHATRQQHYW